MPDCSKSGFTRPIPANLFWLEQLGHQQMLHQALSRLAVGAGLSRDFSGLLFANPLYRGINPLLQ